MKKYLVTGGSGFIGSALVKRLLKDGNQVRVLDNNSRGNLRRLEGVLNKIEFIEGDIRDQQTVFNACKGVDSVCHLAYVNGTEFFYTKPELILEIAVKGMMNVIDGCLLHKVEELVLASSSEVYQHAEKVPTDESTALVVPDVLNPRYSYGGGKIISELLAVNYGRNHFKRVLIFRPHNVYGPDMGWEHVIPQFVFRMKDVIDAKTKNSEGIDFPIQGTGEETRSFIYIDDFCDGVACLLEKGIHNEIYHIGTEDELPIKAIAKEIGSYFGTPVNILPGELLKGGTPRRCPDISKIRKLGFNPKTSLKTGIQKTADWYIANAALRKTTKTA
jgi:nucleoside-diphosphate-sugar epimerase